MSGKIEALWLIVLECIDGREWLTKDFKPVHTNERSAKREYKRIRSICGSDGFKIVKFVRTEPTEQGFDEATETRWQKAIYEVCKEAVGPEHYSEIDGGGCDSGDALDFTLTEIRQALSFVKELESRSAPDTQEKI